MRYSIRNAAPGDIEALTSIYNHYVRESIATFEEQEISKEAMGSRVSGIVEASYPWLVAENEGSIIGYSYAAKWKDRLAYRFSVESTVYLDSRYVGLGVGTGLCRELLAAVRSKSIHAIMAGIALPNEASVALHERLGFEKVAHFRQVGFKFGRWIDVGYWQLIL